MKARMLSWIIAMALFATLAMPLQFAARDNRDHHQHHHYQVIDIGTFGGPSSYFNSLDLTDAFFFPTVFYNIAQVRNEQGTFVGFADTATPDPYPAFCYVPECYVAHAFQWKKGVKTDLGALPGGGSSAAFWVNDKGWITGNSENGKTDPLISGLPELRAVLWKDGQIRDLGTLGGNTSFAQAINNRDQITGLALNGSSDPFSYYYIFLYGFSNGAQTRGFLWDEKNGMQDIGTLGGPDAFPSVINQRGQVAGFSYKNSIPNPNTGLPTYHPFIWEKGKGMKDLGSFGGTQTASVNGLNERGEVVGGLLLPGDAINHPFLWDGERLIDLAVPPFGGTGNGEAMWVNEAGDVVGLAGLPAPCPGTSDRWSQAFLWKNGVMTDLGSLAGDHNSRADFINSKSQIVGASFPCDFSAATAFLWENGAMVDLNTLISPNSPLYLFWASFINDREEISALAGLSNGDTHAVLLIPCDDEHPGVEGCDYSMVEAGATAPRPSPAVGDASSRTLPQSLIRRMNRYRLPGPAFGPRN